MSNLELVQTDILTRTKLLGSVGIEFVQLINPSKFGTQNLTLNSLILAVSVNKIFVYCKELPISNITGIQMFAVTNFSLPEKRCSFYLYEVLNFTAATMISNCEGINYEYRSPLLTISYDPLLPVNASFTYSFSWMRVVPLALRQIYTIVQGQNQSTLVLGILEGPMSAATGKLYLCNTQNCSPLYISTSDSFLLNYAAKVSNSLYVVISIDYLTIQVFINPQVQPNGGPITSNYTIQYSNFIDEVYCSVIKIINITMTNSYGIMSCSSAYYYVNINFVAATIDILQKFVRYSQCDLSDEFKPITVEALNQTTGVMDLQIFFAECKQNDFTYKLQTYETINSSMPIIYTGYLQVFAVNGPLGPNCSSGTSPSKIVPISSPMNYPLFISYSIYGVNQTEIYKFLYS